MAGLPPADERRTMAHVPCVVGTPVDDPAIPMGLPVRSAPVHFDSTGDGVVDSLGFDTTGDGWVDAVQRLQRVDTRQTQHSAAPAIADQERKRRAGRQFIEVAQVSASSSQTRHCALLPRWLSKVPRVPRRRQSARTHTVPRSLTRDTCFPANELPATAGRRASAMSSHSRRPSGVPPAPSRPTSTAARRRRCTCTRSPSSGA